MNAKYILHVIFRFPAYVIAAIAVAVIRLIRPWLLVRCGSLVSTRIGHFAANTELYLCERDAGINVPAQKYIDLFYLTKPISNQQLATMWGRLLLIWPDWLLGAIVRINRLLPCGNQYEIGNNTQDDRDVHNLLDKQPPHLLFTNEEQARGEKGLKSLGIPLGAGFVCLIVRDSAYLAAHMPSGDYNYHNYRDTNIQNYLLAAEELANRGYYVIRMGVKVNNSICSSHPKVIDYATNGMRSDFMDIYLGANCTFCISVGTGFDAIPYIFRRPIAFVNLVPIGHFFSFKENALGIFKHHYLNRSKKKLSLAEIFNHGVGVRISSAEYEAKDISLVENSADEILDLVVEMAARIEGVWQPNENDEILQCRFWEIYTTKIKSMNGMPLHGKIYAKVGSSFLRNNQEWLQ